MNLGRAGRVETVLAKVPLIRDATFQLGIRVLHIQELGCDEDFFRTQILPRLPGFDCVSFCPPVKSLDGKEYYGGGGEYGKGYPCH